MIRQIEQGNSGEGYPNSRENILGRYIDWLNGKAVEFPEIKVIVDRITPLIEELKYVDKVILESQGKEIEVQRGLAEILDVLGKRAGKAKAIIIKIMEDVMTPLG